MISPQLHDGNTRVAGISCNRFCSNDTFGCLNPISVALFHIWTLVSCQNMEAIEWCLYLLAATSLLTMFIVFIYYWYSLKRRRLSPLALAESAILKNSEESGLKVKYISSYIGYGLFATTTYLASDFICVYKGDIISEKEAQKREARIPDSGNYMFSFKHNGQSWCIDGYNSISKARYINDIDVKITKPNCRIKKVVVKGKPHLCVFALTGIVPGDELRYDYGISTSVWRKEHHDTSSDTVTDDTLLKTNPSSVDTVNSMVSIYQ
ncbi:Histone-lysine N-methyltransferase PR-Set7 [Holothuria leucospilota]|uniref:Histone-lysine N-methyltransferase PR-Set7 n=1 Tax=Holothuria leucospilota TaxID=206669 RepID=A0A9Q1CIY7_HOLLE|nr:Histone-lysine N-methyltransferase PR-Set7 [Holothuria leucospilota]